MKILPDSSVWIDYLRGAETVAAQALDAALGRHTIILGDLVLLEVLRGIPDRKTLNRVRRSFAVFSFEPLGGHDIIMTAAENNLRLREQGITIRGTIDLIIATWCLMNEASLLHRDRDFRGFEQYLGLKVWSAEN